MTADTSALAPPRGAGAAIYASDYTPLRGLPARFDSFGAVVPADLARAVEVAEAITAELARVRAADPADVRALVTRLDGAEDLTGEIHRIAEAVEASAARAQRLESLGRLQTAARARAVQAWKDRRARDRLVEALRPAHSAAVDELAEILAKHPSVAGMSATGAVEATDPVRKAWRRRRELTRLVADIESLAREVRGPADRLTALRPWDYQWAELPEALRKGWSQRVADRANGGTRPRHVPSLVEGLAAGGKRWLPTGSDLARLNDERRAGDKPAAPPIRPPADTPPAGKRDRAVTEDEAAKLRAELTAGV